MKDPTAEHRPSGSPWASPSSASGPGAGGGGGFGGGDRIEPTLGLVARGAGGRALVGLLAAVGTQARIVSWRRHRARGGAVPDALVVDDVGLLAGLPPAPTAVRVSNWDELDEAAAAEVEVAFHLSGGPVPVERGHGPTGRGPLEGGGAIGVPRFGLRVIDHPVMPPLVRSRVRRRHGLSDRLLVEVNDGGPAEMAATSLAVASAAVVTGSHLPLALALGTPVVTFGDDVERLGLHPGWEVEVAGSTAEAEALVAALADDEHRASACSRRARRFAEDHLDLGRPARSIRRRLGLETPVFDPGDVVATRLSELATPSSARIAARADRALADLRRSR